MSGQVCLSVYLYVRTYVCTMYMCHSMLQSGDISTVSIYKLYEGLI